MKTLINDGLRFVCHTEQELWRARTLLTKEPGTIAWLNRVLKPGSVFYDIGANVGCYTLYAARIVGESGHVYAFEPHPANAAALLRNIKANGFGARVTVIAAPLFSGDGLVQFRCTSIDAGTSHHGGASGVPVVMAALSIDEWREADFTEARRKPTAIKIDVDGSEDDILDGAGITIGFAMPSIQVEIGPSNEAAVHRTLTRMGYSAHDEHWTKDGVALLEHGTAPAQTVRNRVYEPVAVPA